MSFLCFKSSLVVNGPFKLCFLELLRKRLIHLNTLNVLRSKNFDNSLSNMFSIVNVVARISLIFSLFFIRFLAIFNFWLFRPLCLILEPFRTFPPFIVKLTYFTTSSPKIGCISFRKNTFPFDKTSPLHFRHLITTYLYSSLSF